MIQKTCLAVLIGLASMGDTRVLIEQALYEPAKLHFDKVRLVDALRTISEQTGVKIVLTGHHHMSKVDKLNGRLHVSTPSIAGYPCAYRTFQLAQQGEGWRLSWQTHSATDPETIAKARHLMQSGWQEFVGFEADFVSEYVRLSLGSDEDRQGTAVL